MIDKDWTRQAAPPSPQDEERRLTHAKGAAIVAGIVLAGIVVLSAVTPSGPPGPNGNRAAVKEVADRLTHEEIADAWTQSKLGRTGPMRRIQETFPLPPRAVYDDGAGIVLDGHGQNCVDFVSYPASSIVSARRC